jgi:hypothetical protein
MALDHLASLALGVATREVLAVPGIVAAKPYQTMNSQDFSRDTELLRSIQTAFPRLVVQIEVVPLEGIGPPDIRCWSGKLWAPPLGGRGDATSAKTVTVGLVRQSNAIPVRG